MKSLDRPGIGKHAKMGQGNDPETCDRSRIQSIKYASTS